MFSFLRKKDKQPSAFQQAFERAQVETKSYVPYSVKNAKMMIDVLRDIEKDSELANQIFPVLRQTFSGDDLPIEIVGFFDDALPEGHVFFKDDKMDVFTKTFMESVLFYDEKGQIQLDTTHFDRQFREIKRNMGEPAAYKML